jgi:hypothetical protein
MIYIYSYFAAAGESGQSVSASGWRAGAAWRPNGALDRQRVAAADACARAGAYGSEPGLSASGVMSPSRGGCYTCAPCGIRFACRKWRSNFAIHTNMFMTGNDPSTYAHRRQARLLATSSLVLFSLYASGAHLISTTKVALLPLHAYTVWPLPFL